MKKSPHGPEHIKNTKLPTTSGQEIAYILAVDTPYAILREKFMLLYTYCIQSLGLTPEYPERQKTYKDIMNHYLRNGANYFLVPGSKNIDKESYANYQLFQSVIVRIGELSEDKKTQFLNAIHQHYETDKTEPTENSIIVMDCILSSL